MSSAAKLRNRGIAIAGATALVMTSFGPAAFAWTAPGTPPNNANAAGAASIGLVDTDRSKDDTQGATAVVANPNIDQAVGDIRLVVPATYAVGDYIDVALPQESDITKRVNWTAQPVVSVNGPYGTATHVGADSGTTSNPGETEEITPGATAFVPAPGEKAPSTPNITATLVTDSWGANKIRLKFNTLADSSEFNAKFAITLSGLKINVGSGATGDADGTPGDIVVDATAYQANGTPAPLTFWGDGVNNQNETIPAVLSNVSLTADTAALTSDGTVQSLGPITVAATNGSGFTLNAPVTVAATGATLAASPGAQVTWYNASGQAIGAPAAATVNTGAGTVTANAPAGAVRAVFTGVNVATADGTPGVVDLAIAAGGGGGIIPVTADRTSAAVNQTDINAPSNAQARVAINPVVQRLGGSSRYETAVKMAEELALSSAYTNQEVDNLVIASGESFPDALSAGYLAQTKNAPIVLAQKAELPDMVEEYIRAHGVKNVFIVGGPKAVSANVEAKLKATEAFDIDSSTGVKTAMNAKLQVTRIAGGGRFDTNRLVNEYAAARTTTPVGTTVLKYGQAARKTGIVVNGLTPWDALAAGPMVAGQDDGTGTSRGALPIVLTSGSTLGADAKKQLQTLDLTHAIFVGGNSVLPQSLEKEAAGYGTTSTRIGGLSRWQTAEAVGNFLLAPSAVSPSTTNVGFQFTTSGTQRNPYLVNGGVPKADAWADALAAGPLAAQEKSVLALTAATYLPADTKDMLTKNNALLADVIAVGLGQAVSTEVVGQANQAVK